MLKQVPVIVFGAGGVGQALLRQIVNGRSQTESRNHCSFKVVAVADSRTVFWNINGLTDEQLLTIISHKEAGLPVAQGSDYPSATAILEQAYAAGLTKVIVVDVTAVAGMEPMLNKVLALGYSAVLANKKPFAGPWQTAQNYFNHPRIRHESTVGGGQPVIATLRYLLDVNDPIYEIEGQLSGTLGYICNQLDQGIAFSEAVTAAKSKGYTEPDPRDDLGGQDVMRKVMILGRMAGWPLKTTDITVESLYPHNLADTSVPDFMAALPTLDKSIKQRVAAAATEGQVLRYLAHLHQGGGQRRFEKSPYRQFPSQPQIY